MSLYSPPEVHNKPIDAQIKQCNQCNYQINPIIQPNDDFSSTSQFHSSKISFSSVCANLLNSLCLFIFVQKVRAQHKQTSECVLKAVIRFYS